MLPFLGEVYGNPSSIHHVGRVARSLLDDFRHRLATVLGCKASQLAFTSGGTESNNLAVFGVARCLKPKGRHLITSKVEHHSVLNCFESLARLEGFDVTYLPVDSFGLVNPDDLKRSIRPDTILVSVLAANNETGAIQPIAELGSICRSRGVVFHTDAVQWFGKLPFSNIEQFNADLVSLCSHKFHGPKGAGALFFQSSTLLDPLLLGGGHENERRAGTESLCSIAGLVTAAERFLAPPVFPSAPLFSLTSRLWSAASAIDGVTPVGPFANRLPNTLSFTATGCDSLSLLAALDLDGVCASSGAACSSGSLNPSHVLLAMGVQAALANSFVRFSLGRESSTSEVEAVCSLLPSLVSKARLS
jgi:cysteine desulfurase